MIITMDCRAGMAALPANSVDAIVCDPPYGLSKQPDMHEVLKHWLNGDEYSPNCGGFMGKKWDSFVPGPLVWEQAFRVLKPGGYLVAFAGSRTVDLMAMSLRLGGFEVVDMLHWLYGSGFPKSMAIDKAIDRQRHDRDDVLEVTEWIGQARDAAKQWEGWGTALKPCHEPIVLCRKPLDGTFAHNVQKHGLGALNIEGCRITGGRWPGNVLHDGCLPEPMDRYFYSAKATKADREAGLEEFDTATAGECTGGREEGSAGLNSPRSGAGRTDGGKNVHPTVKPTEVMRWLCRLITPPGGLILDPFTGSGSTGRGAVLEGFRFMGFELSEEYAEIARARIADAVKEAACQ